MTALILRPDTTDALIYNAVFAENEYRIPEQLAEGDRIIDVGAHIGSFSALCWQRGARNIQAFEAHPENAQIAAHNLQATGVKLQQKAVWRSDITYPVTLFHSGFAVQTQTLYKPLREDEEIGEEIHIPADGINVGGGDVFAQSGEGIAAISLDEIIGSERVRILKIDCEGSEFPILLTSKRLGQIDCIVGEYHLFDTIPPRARLDNIPRYTLGVLADLLTENRFRVEFIPHRDRRFSHIGNFFAYNLDLA